MIAIIIVIVVVAVLLVGVGGTVLLRPRGMHGVKRGRARELDLTGPLPKASDSPATGGGTATATAPPSAADLLAPTAPAAPTLEKPPPSAGRMVRLRARLARSQGGFGSALLQLLSRDRLDDDTWDEIEEVLITADVGVTPARLMVDELKTKVKVLGTRSPDDVRGLLKAELLTQLDEGMDRSLHTTPSHGVAAVILMVGVNGTGKTTTCGKLARALIGDGETVLLGAADTFRAAAADQLQTWGERVGAEVVRSERENADPASVAFEAVSEGIDTGA